MQPIVKNNPIPEIRRRGAVTKYPWRDMQPGDSFQFTPGVSAAAASSMAHSQGQTLCMRFIVRRKPDDSVWCWRVDGMKNPPRNANLKEDVPLVRGNPLAGAALEEFDVGYQPRIQPDEEVI
jgi:hypothetical protein